MIVLLILALATGCSGYLSGDVKVIRELEMTSQIIELSDVQIGDKIRDHSGRYTIVIGWLYIEPHASGKFYQFDGISINPHHPIKINGSYQFPEDLIKLKHHVIHRRGIYAPLTKSFTYTIIGNSQEYNLHCFSRFGHPQLFERTFDLLTIALKSINIRSSSSSTNIVIDFLHFIYQFSITFMVFIAGFMMVF